MAQEINIGSRVYCKFAIAGEPGVVIGFDRHGRSRVEWYDLGITTTHDPENLVIDEGFKVEQKLFDFGEWAA